MELRKGLGDSNVFLHTRNRGQGEAVRAWEGPAANMASLLKTESCSVSMPLAATPLGARSSQSSLLLVLVPDFH